MKKTIFALLMALLLTVPVFGTETEVIDETRIPIEDTRFDSMGWLAIRANTPERFEGTLYIELINNATGECFTVRYHGIYLRWRKNDSPKNGVWITVEHPEDIFL